MGNVKTCQDVKTRWRERKSGAWVPLSCKKEFKRMWKSELVSHHVVGPVSDGLVPRSRNTLLGVSVTEAASLHYQVVDGKVSGGRVLVCRVEVFGLARTRLTLQQPDSDVGHPQLLLALRPERIQGFPLWQRAVDHLLVREGDLLSHLLLCTPGYFPGGKRHDRNLKSDQKSHQDSIEWPNKDRTPFSLVSLQYNETHGGKW